MTFPPPPPPSAPPPSPPSPSPTWRRHFVDTSARPHRFNSAESFSSWHAPSVPSHAPPFHPPGPPRPSEGNPVPFVSQPASNHHQPALGWYRTQPAHGHPPDTQSPYPPASHAPDYRAHMPPSHSQGFQPPHTAPWPAGFRAPQQLTSTRNPVPVGSGVSNTPFYPAPQPQSQPYAPPQQRQQPYPPQPVPPSPLNPTPGVLPPYLSVTETTSHAPPSNAHPPSMGSYSQPLHPHTGSFEQQVPPRPAPHGYPMPPSLPTPSSELPQLDNTMTGNFANQIANGISVGSMGAPLGTGEEEISLELKAVGLPNRDVIGKSDPVCHVFVQEGPLQNSVRGGLQESSGWRRAGSTEVLENTLSPTWARRIKMPFRFEQHQPLRFVLVDVDNWKTLKGQALGECTTTLGEVARNGVLKLPVKGSLAGKSYGSLIVRAHDENQAGKVRVKLAFGGKNLDKKDLWGESDPFYVLRQVLSNSTSTLYKSEELKSNANPTWKPHVVMIPANGQGWDDIKLQVDVYDWNKFNSPKFIGQATFSLADLVRQQKFDLINQKKALGRSKYKNSGELIVHRADAAQMPHLVSYLQGGLRLNFIVAVDFTKSNRPVDRSDSLHYISDPGRPSPYARALHAVGSILSGYTPDQVMSALGFGAILPSQSKPSFDFALTGQSDPRVPGVSGLLAAYEQAVKNVTLDGPTKFAPLLRNCRSLASMYPVSQNNQHFTVVLVLTDGMITDLRETIDTIIECSHSTPMAIVIVGIGDADFTSMERLDSDDELLRSVDGSRQARHDIVHFTKFDSTKPIEALAADVLREMPTRIVEFMVDANIQPNPPLL